METNTTEKYDKKIILAAPRGFCAGVDRAIDIVETALRVHGTPLYVNHEIVHNLHVVSNLKNQGVIFVNHLEEVPTNSNVIFSAHGVSPELWEIARERNLHVIDATCPLVTKVHMEAKRYARQNFNIILIGHKNHVEAIGTQGEAPNKITIVEKKEDVYSLSFTNDFPLAYITQTTLSIRDTKEIIEALKEKFPNIVGPSKSDICYATTNRQEAVSQLANKVDLIFVIGSKNSSNSTRLKELSETLGTPSYLIENHEHIESSFIPDSVKTIGITAGASAPEILVKEVIEHLQRKFQFQKIEELRVKEENVVFQIPKSLKAYNEKKQNP